MPVVRIRHRTWWGAIVVALSFLPLVPVLAAGAAPGDLDVAFSSDGYTTADVGDRADTAVDVVVQADGKVAVLGYDSFGGQLRPGLARFLGDGSPDSSLGSGSGTHVIGALVGMRPRAAALHDTKYVLAGYMNVGGHRAIAVARVLSSGSLDSTFAGDGLATISFGTGDDEALGVAVEPSGKVVVVGYAEIGDAAPVFAVARLRADGTIDTSFSLDGRVTVSPGPGADVARDVVVQADGKIVVVGSSVAMGGEDFSAARLSTSGALDGSFGSSGTVMTPLAAGDDLAHAVALQSDGKIVLAGQRYSGGTSANDDFALARYLPDGALDPAFDGDGKVFTAFTSSQRDIAQDVLVQPDGKIVAVGSFASEEGFAIARYGTTGSLDTAFSGDGKVATAFTALSEAAAGAALDASGNIVVAGTTTTVEPSSDYLAARYLGAGDPPAEPPPPPPSLATDVVAGSPAVPVGSVLSLEVTVANEGAGETPWASLDVSLDAPPGSVKVRSASPSQGTCSVGASVACSLGALAAGAGATLTVEISALRTGTATFTSIVEGDQDAFAASDPVAVSIVPNAAGCTIVGTATADTILGTRGDDVICSGGGNDVVTAGRGEDRMRGAAGGDRLRGGAGRDLLIGGPGADLLNGGRNRDSCLGGAGRDRFRRCERQRG